MTDLVERIRASVAARALTFAVGYCAALECGHLFKSPTGLAPFWPAAGLFVAALTLLSRRSSWPALVGAACLASLVSDVVFHGQSLAVSLGYCVARCGEAVLGAGMLRLAFARPITLSRISEVVGFVGAAVLAGPVWGATVGAGVASLHGTSSFGPFWRAWWVADAVGVLVTAPLILAWAGEGKAHFLGKRPGRVVEFVALFLGLALVDLAVYRDLLPPPWNVPTFILPFLLWAAVRFNPAATSAAVMLVAVIGFWSVSDGRGPFSALTPDRGEQILRAQGTLAVIAISVMLLAAVVAERKRVERQKVALIEELERALTEIKTLRNLIPVCSWCRKIRDDRGYWQSLEVYMTDHYDAKITHGICPACVEVNFSDVSPPSPKRSPPAEGRTADVTNDGPGPTGRE